ncbi:hypothetical protein SAMN04487996_109317 [Dyadobacter soli]|uniref:Uncharacterized protein n=1 Tax=Dyadobacter soli TaxID=659014 RepID=A0A1G7JKG8_9BACT|nr:hypothetical protein [Dyadobacter soli]SDF25345.1 hypothetical protein SAMN04487996_109317 [Dyadobacter soli]
MSTPAISQNDFDALRKENELLKRQLETLHDKEFRDKLEWAYHLFHDPADSAKLELKRGSGKGIISRVPDNFTDELTDFNALEYSSISNFL